MSRSRYRSGAPLLLVPVVIGIVYLPALELGYVWDDIEIFINNPALHKAELVWNALFTPILPATGYIRPLALGSFSLEFLTFGLNASLSHAINLALHLGNTLLLLSIARRLNAQLGIRGGTWRLVAVGLGYGLHPGLIEPVAWVMGRFDLLVTFFCLLGIWGYVTLRGWRRDLWVSLSFILAALSKEMAVTLPVILFLIYLGQPGRVAKWRSIAKDLLASGEWRLYALLGLAGAAIFFFRWLVMGHPANPESATTPSFANPLQHLAFVGHTLLFFIRMSLFPFVGLNPQHALDPADLGTAAICLGIGTLVLVALILMFLIHRRSWPPLLLAGWLMALLPVLNIIPLSIGGISVMSVIWPFP